VQTSDHRRWENRPFFLFSSALASFHPDDDNDCDDYDCNDDDDDDDDDDDVFQVIKI